MTGSNQISLGARAPSIDTSQADSFAVFARTMGIRALARNVSGVVSDVADSGLPVILTKHGRPVAAIVPIGPSAPRSSVVAGRNQRSALAADDRRRASSHRD